LRKKQPGKGIIRYDYNKHKRTLTLNKKLNTILLIFLVYFSVSSAVAQTTTDLKTIKVKKEATLVKAAFDEADFKVIAFDRFGNPHENAVKSFVIFYKEKNSAYEKKISGNVFTEEVINYLSKKRKTATKICISSIIAETSDGHLEELPSLCDIVIFPDCKKVKKS
jgi:hypothetical protein